MVKVRALDRGYVGGMIRNPGEKFDWPEGSPLGRWVEALPFGGKGDHDGDGKAGGAAAKVDPVAVTVPADWQNMSARDRKALAKSIGGAEVANVKDADAVIEAYLDANKAAPFEGEGVVSSVDNGVTKALGGTQPDWVAPGHIEKPTQTDD